jgi:hypothetical protein
MCGDVYSVHVAEDVGLVAGCWEPWSSVEGEEFNVRWGTISFLRRTETLSQSIVREPF